jgi:uroporphyrinogen decarboxylase
VEFYKVIIDRYKEAGCDGIFTSDDLGHQHGPMMSPAIFEELYLPLYKEIIGYTHEKGMHFFLHSCGDNTVLMDYLIEAGLDVFHPVQKGCMDIEDTAQRFGNKITFLASVDVQQLLPNGTPDQIHKDIAYMKKTFKTTNG